MSFNTFKVFDCLSLSFQFFFTIFFAKSVFANAHDFMLQSDCNVVSSALERARQIAIANGNNDQTLDSFIGNSPKAYVVKENDQNYPQFPKGSYVITAKRDQPADPIRMIVYLYQPGEEKFTVTEYEGDSAKSMKALRTYESTTPPITRSRIQEINSQLLEKKAIVEQFIEAFERLFGTNFNRSLFQKAQKGNLQIEDAFGFARTAQILEMKSLSSLMLPYAKTLGKEKLSKYLNEKFAQDVTFTTDDQIRLSVIADTLRVAREKYALKDVSDQVARQIITEIFP